MHSFEEGREETGVGDGAFSSFSVGHEGEDETGGRHTAETAVLFDEDDFHSFSRRGYGGEGAGETAARLLLCRSCVPWLLILSSRRGGFPLYINMIVHFCRFVNRFFKSETVKIKLFLDFF